MIWADKLAKEQTVGRRMLRKAKDKQKPKHAEGDLDDF